MRSITVREGEGPSNEGEDMYGSPTKQIRCFMGTWN